MGGKKDILSLSAPLFIAAALLLFAIIYLLSL